MVWIHDPITKISKSIIHSLEVRFHLVDEVRKFIFSLLRYYVLIVKNLILKVKVWTNENKKKFEYLFEVLELRKLGENFGRKMKVFFDSCCKKFRVYSMVELLNWIFSIFKVTATYYRRFLWKSWNARNGASAKAESA